MKSFGMRLVDGDEHEHEHDFADEATQAQLSNTIHLVKWILTGRYFDRSP